MEGVILRFHAMRKFISNLAWMLKYCHRGQELLKGLQRAEWLPTFDEEGIRVILNEMIDIHAKLTSLTASNPHPQNEYDDPTRATVFYLLACLNRNRLYVNSYLVHRESKIRELRWETGPVIPASIEHDTLSAHENDYFVNYNSMLSSYNDSIGLDITADVEPPKDLLIVVRVLQSCGEIMTDNGPIKLDMGTTHFLRRSDVEHLIRQGVLEQILSDEC